MDPVSTGLRGAFSHVVEPLAAGDTRVAKINAALCFSRLPLIVRRSLLSVRDVKMRTSRHAEDLGNFRSEIDRMMADETLICG